ncbi:MAG TPA: ABC transporter permease [Azospirillaceae bacterium]|nr:ABC transporter permease [Azospirillaceae bacterium]
MNATSADVTGAGRADPQAKSRPDSWGAGTGAAVEGRAGRGAGALAWVPWLTLALFLGPVAAGLAGTLLPAFGYLPALGGTTLSVEPFRRLFEAPGLATAVRLSLVSGLGATVLSLALAIGLAAAWHGTRASRAGARVLPVLLALPHLSVAFGLAFLLAPGGWIVRLAAPWLGGGVRPPDLVLVQDPWGLSLMLGLVPKETAFLLLATLVALGQVRADAALRTAAALGYGPVAAWVKMVLPRVYPQIRLPLYAVLAYGLSNVDMAMVLGPGTPPTLGVLVLGWFVHPDLSWQYPAAAGAVLQLVLVLGCIALWRGAEWGAARAGAGWLVRGGRGGAGRGVRAVTGTVWALAVGAVALGLAGMVVWSFARGWFFPDVLPSAWTTANWARASDRLGLPLGNTLLVAVASVAVAVVLAVGCLEHERHGLPGRRPRALWLVYVPLLLPQIGFLFGVQVLLVRADLDGTWIAVAWMHLVFVLPYVFLALADPWRSLDPRYARAAAALGRGPLAVFVRVTCPLMLRPLLVAAAIGVAVSVGQYLPTLFAGGGRFPTLTTEALSLSSGGDRRVVGVFAVAQAVVPLAAFALALGVPAWLFRHRRGMGAG